MIEQTVSVDKVVIFKQLIDTYNTPSDTIVAPQYDAYFNVYVFPGYYTRGQPVVGKKDSVMEITYTDLK